MTPRERTVRQRLRGWARRDARPLVLGHRGARGRAPENTMAAFDLAVGEGADGVELDVRLNRDGDVVVIHDPTLTRVTEGRDTRRVEDVGTRELADVDVGGGERVPSLRDVLRWARDRGARVNVELKRDVDRRASFVFSVVRLIAAEPDAGDRLLISSFDPLLLFAAARLLPRVPAGWLVEPKRAVPGRSLVERLVGAAAVHPHFSLVTRDAIAPWVRAGLLVNVWTVNDVEEARRLAALGVDAIISDEAGKILNALK